jgi:hypothetical protein
MAASKLRIQSRLNFIAHTSLPPSLLSLAYLLISVPLDLRLDRKERKEMERRTLYVLNHG